MGSINHIISVCFTKGFSVFFMNQNICINAIGASVRVQILPSQWCVSCWMTWRPSALSHLMPASLIHGCLSRILGLGSGSWERPPEYKMETQARAMISTYKYHCVCIVSIGTYPIYRSRSHKDMFMLVDNVLWAFSLTLTYSYSSPLPSPYPPLFHLTVSLLYSLLHNIYTHICIIYITQYTHSHRIYIWSSIHNWAKRHCIWLSEFNLIYLI